MISELSDINTIKGLGILCVEENCIIINESGVANFGRAKNSEKKEFK